LTVGVIGAGEITTKIHLPAMTAMNGVRIAYIADVNLNAARQAGASYGIDSLGLDGDPSSLPSTDVALLAIPVGARAPFYELFAGRGTAVFAESLLQCPAMTPIGFAAFFLTTGSRAAFNDDHLRRLMW